MVESNSLGFHDFFGFSVLSTISENQSARKKSGEYRGEMVLHGRSEFQRVMGMVQGDKCWK